MSREITDQVAASFIHAFRLYISRLGSDSDVTDDEFWHSFLVKHAELVLALEGLKRNPDGMLRSPERILAEVGFYRS